MVWDGPLILDGTKWGGHRGPWAIPLPGSIQNEGAIPDLLAVSLVWFYPK